MTRSRLLLLTGLLGGVTALGPLSIDTTLPAMPAIADAFGTGYASVQLSLSAFMLGIALGQIVIGPLSDGFGRRPIMLAGVALYILSTIGCANAPTVEWLMTFRLLQGFAACAGQVLARAIIRDRFDREDAARLLSYVLMVHGIAPLIGPIIGAHIAVDFDWRAIFWFLALYCAGLAVLLWSYVGESIPARDPNALRPVRLLFSYWEILRNRTFFGYMMCTACCSSGLFAYLSGSSAVIIDGLGKSVETYGYLFALAMTGYVVGNFISARLVRRTGIDRLIKVGGTGLALSGLVMGALGWAGVNTVAAIVAPMFCFMFAFPLVVPPAQAAALSPFPHAAGRASSLIGFLQLCIAAAVGTIVGQLDDGTQGPMVTTIAIAGFGPLLSYWLILKRPKAALGTN